MFRLILQWKHCQKQNFKAWIIVDSTLTVVAGVDAVARHRDVLSLAVQRLQEGHQVLVVGQFLGDGERHDHHVDGCVAFCEGAEQRRDGTVQLLHRAFRCGRRVAVVLGVTHPCRDKEVRWWEIKQRGPSPISTLVPSRFSVHMGKLRPTGHVKLFNLTHWIWRNYIKQ